MIPFDFIYCRPQSLEEALQAYEELQRKNKNPLYYAGGSEIITLSRAGSLQPGAVIDIKDIPPCKTLFMDEKALHIGAACTLNQIKETQAFPLLGTVCGRIADHSNQCRITLGGNLCGTILYRETSLPLLIADAEVTLFGEKGLRTLAFESIFPGEIQISPEEFLVQLHIPLWALKARYFHVKRTQNEKIDYPLVSMAALETEEGLRLAFSGLCAHPFRSRQMEAVLNDTPRPPAQRIEEALSCLPQPPYSDRQGSGAYRIFVLKNTLQALLEEAEYDSI